jgi:hypothetical protein
MLVKQLARGTLAQAVWATMPALVVATGTAFGDPERLARTGPFAGATLGTPALFNAVIGYDLAWTTLRVSGAYLGELNGIQAEFAPLTVRAHGILLRGFVVGGYVDYARGGDLEAKAGRDQQSYLGAVGEAKWRGVSVAPGVAATSKGDLAPLLQVGYTVDLGGQPGE